MSVGIVKESASSTDEASVALHYFGPFRHESSVWCVCVCTCRQLMSVRSFHSLGMFQNRASGSTVLVAAASSGSFVDKQT